MRRRLLLPLVLWCMAWAAVAADDEQAVRAADARYWQAYNACDMHTMGDLLTDDVEFYHDKTGLTTSKEAVLNSLRKGPCADTAMHLRREADDTSIRFHPLAGGFALLSGTHRFYVRRDGTPERLDGQAEFTNVWQSIGGHWRMRRILSYAHGAAPYTPPATHITLPLDVLKFYAGTYIGKTTGQIQVTVEGDHLRLTSGPLAITLQAESQTRFFALERDLQFDFSGLADDRHRKLTIYENGEVVETANAK